jgi:hypothetical protein
MGHQASDCPDSRSLYARRAHLQAKDRCSRCTKKGHEWRECKTELKCKICKGPHHPILCPTNFVNDKSRKNAQNKSKQGGAEGSRAAFAFPKFTPPDTPGQERTPPADRIPYRPPKYKPALPIVATCQAEVDENEESDVVLTIGVIEASNPSIGCSCTTTALFDSGSSFTFIRTSLAQRLKLPVDRKARLFVSAFGETHSQAKNYKVYKLYITEGKRKRLISAYGRDELTSESVALTDFARNLSANALEIRGMDATIPELILGADLLWEMVKGVVERLPSGFFVIESTVGKLISGKGKVRHDTHIDGIVNIANETHHDTIDHALEKLWMFETIGVLDSYEENDEEIAMKMFTDSIRWDEEERRYVAKWPWKSIKCQITENYGLALGRLQSTLKKLQSRPEELQAYNRAFEEMLSLGTIEDLLRSPQDPESITGPRVYYIYYMPYCCKCKQGAAEGPSRFRCIKQGTAKFVQSE